MWNKSIFWLPEKKPTKRWKLGALSLISAMIAAASLVSAPSAAAKPAAQGITEEQGVRATLNVRLQSIRLAFKTFPNRKIWRTEVRFNLVADSISLAYDCRVDHGSGGWQKVIP